MFTFDSIPHMRSKVEASEIKNGNVFSRRTSPSSILAASRHAIDSSGAISLRIALLQIP